MGYIIYMTAALLTFTVLLIKDEGFKVAIICGFFWWIYWPLRIASALQKVG